jgi:multidrug efflux pump subunit AcrA (membrane-fusion protein)
MKRITKLLSVFLITALLLGGCSVFGIQSTPASTPVPTVQGSESVISQGNLVPKESMYLSFSGGGHVAEILVQQGDHVTAGQVLASLGDRQPYQANLTGAKLEVENAQQALNNLNDNTEISSTNARLGLLDANQGVDQAETAWNNINTDEYQIKIDTAEITVSDTLTILDDAQTEYDKYANLDPNNPTRLAATTALDNAQVNHDDAVHTRDQLVTDRDRAEANLQLARALQVQAQKDYDSTRAGPDPNLLTLAQMNLENAQSHLDAAQAAMDNLDLKAPINGTVVDVNVSVGELISSGTWAILLADFSEWYVETNDLTEQEVVKISVGQGATLTSDALPDLSLRGEVTEIADTSHMQSGDVLYQVRLLLDKPDPNFRWGMTVEVTFNP